VYAPLFELQAMPVSHSYMNDSCSKLSIINSFNTMNYYMKSSQLLSNSPPDDLRSKKVMFNVQENLISQNMKAVVTSLTQPHNTLSRLRSIIRENRCYFDGNRVTGSNLSLSSPVMPLVILAS
jgi:hypothetical protein